MTGSFKDEMLRKGIHLGSGILMAVVYWFFEKNVLVFIHLFFLLGIWFLEFLRLKGAIQVPFLRNTERQRIGAHAFFMLSTLISILVFDRRIAIASILMLTIGDPAAGLAQRFKAESSDSIEGHTAVLKPPDMILIMLIASWVTGYLFLGSLVISLSGAIGAALADALRLKVGRAILDDNLTIPLYAGFFMSLASLW
jgi:dolichol kinase